MPNTDRQKQIKRCDMVWSEYIRKRAIVEAHGCQRCLSFKNNYQELQAAHCFGRDRLVTRWLMENGCGLCGGCHLYIDTHEDAKFELFRKLIGDSKEFERLYLLHNMTSRQSSVDLTLTEIALKALIKELDSCYVTT